MLHFKIARLFCPRRLFCAGTCLIASVAPADVIVNGLVFKSIFGPETFTPGATLAASDISAPAIDNGVVVFSAGSGPFDALYLASVDDPFNPVILADAETLLPPDNTAGLEQSLHVDVRGSQVLFGSDSFDPPLYISDGSAVSLLVTNGAAFPEFDGQTYRFIRDAFLVGTDQVLILASSNVSATGNQVILMNDDGTNATVLIGDNAPLGAGMLDSVANLRASGEFFVFDATLRTADDAFGVVVRGNIDGTVEIIAADGFAQDFPGTNPLNGDHIVENAAISADGRVAFEVNGPSTEVYVYITADATIEATDLVFDQSSFNGLQDGFTPIALDGDLFVVEVLSSGGLSDIIYAVNLSTDEVFAVSDTLSQPLGRTAGSGATVNGGTILRSQGIDGDTGKIALAYTVDNARAAVYVATVPGFGETPKAAFEVKARFATDAFVASPRVGTRMIPDGQEGFAISGTYASLDGDKVFAAVLNQDRSVNKLVEVDGSTGEMVEGSDGNMLAYAINDNGDEMTVTAISTGFGTSVVGEASIPLSSNNENTSLNWTIGPRGNFGLAEVDATGTFAVFDYIPTSGTPFTINLQYPTDPGFGGITLDAVYTEPRPGSDLPGGGTLGPNVIVSSLISYDNGSGGALNDLFVGRGSTFGSELMATSIRSEIYTPRAEVVNFADNAFMVILDGQLGGADHALAYLDASGDEVWSRTLQGIAEITGVAQTSDGRFVILGKAQNPQTEAMDTALALLDETGSLVASALFDFGESEGVTLLGADGAFAYLDGFAGRVLDGTPFEFVAGVPLDLNTATVYASAEGDATEVTGFFNPFLGFGVSQIVDDAVQSRFEFALLDPAAGNQTTCDLVTESIISAIAFAPTLGEAVDVTVGVPAGYSYSTPGFRHAFSQPFRTLPDGIPLETVGLCDAFEGSGPPEPLVMSIVPNTESAAQLEIDLPATGVYHLETTTDLTSGQWTFVEEFVDMGDAFTRMASLAGGQGFWRVREIVVAPVQ